MLQLSFSYLLCERGGLQFQMVQVQVWSPFPTFLENCEVGEGFGKARYP